MTTMIKLGAVFLLFMVHCEAQGPFHATADNFGQVYQVSVSSDPVPVVKAVPVGPFLNGPTGTGTPLPKFKVIPLPTHIAFAATNLGLWSGRSNPSGFILSSDSGTPIRIVTDGEWKCNQHDDVVVEDAGEISWPISDTAIAAVKADAGNYATLLPAVALYPNWNFVYGNTRFIDLGANWIWYAGVGVAGKDSVGNPATKVVCVKKL